MYSYSYIHVQIYIRTCSTSSLVICIGVHVDTSNQCYYNNYHFHFRHPWAKQTISDSIDNIEKVDHEDHVTIRRKLASQTGFTGLSILHRLFHLYQFDILNDLVFDTMHTLILRVIYRHLHYYSEEGFLKNPMLDEWLSAMPWTAGLILTFSMHVHGYTPCIIQC